MTQRPPGARALLSDAGFATLREIDIATGCAKGSAFRAFKALAERLVEGEHFHCCDSRDDTDGFALVVASGRVYPGTVNAVFLRADAQSLVRERLMAAAG